MLSLTTCSGTGTRGSKHSQHVAHCLSGLRLNTVEQLSGRCQLCTNIERPAAVAITPYVNAGLLWSSSSRELTAEIAASGTQSTVACPAATKVSVHVARASISR